MQANLAGLPGPVAEDRPVLNHSQFVLLIFKLQCLIRVDE